MNRIENQTPLRLPKKNSDNSVHSVKKSEQLVSLLLVWFSANARDLPWRRTRDPYAIWVSEVMLQQTQVKTVIRYWERWLRELPTIAALAKAPSEKIHKLWEGLGYYTRVRNMQKAARQILERHGGKFPEDFENILTLPGIGRYTAGAISSIAFNQPTPILDGNVIRVLTRVFGILENPKEKRTNEHLWQLAGTLVDIASRFTAHAPNCSHLNQSLMELGALLCTPRAPQCAVCPVRMFCVARKKNLQEQLPHLGKRAAATERRFLAFVIERAGKFLVRQRPAGVVNAHLWEFPNIEVHTQLPAPRQVVAEFNALRLTGSLSEKLAPICTVRHSITRYRITLEAYRAVLANPRRKHPGHWLKLPELKKLSFPSAHKKILAALAEAG